MSDIDPDRGAWYLGINLACFTLGFFGVLLRLYTRLFLTRSFGSDDVAIIPAFISNIAGEIVDILSICAGLGHHAVDLSPENIEYIKKHTYTAWIRAFLTYWFIRCSVMLFTLRLLPCTKVWARRVIYVAFFLNFAITLIACVCYGIECVPFRANWTDVPGSHCKSQVLLLASQQVNGVLACIIDVTTALIPAFLLWGVSIKRKTKLVLDAIFLLGLITAALSIGRAATTNSKTYGPDITYLETVPGILSVVEINMGTFFACCPVIRQAIVYYWRHHTLLPVKGRNLPDQDFAAFRKRLTLRDIFWYRKATSNEISPPPNAPPQKPRDISEKDKPVKISAAGRIWRNTGRIFGVSRRKDYNNPDYNDVSHTEKALKPSQGENGKEGGKTFLLSATNGSTNGWPLRETMSGSTAYATTNASSPER